MFASGLFAKRAAMICPISFFKTPFRFLEEIQASPVFGL